MQVDPVKADADAVRTLQLPESLHSLVLSRIDTMAEGPRRTLKVASVVGRVESGPAAGRIVAVRQGPLLATSFHPEVGGDTRVHELFVDLVRRG